MDGTDLVLNSSFSGNNSSRFAHHTMLGYGFVKWVTDAPLLQDVCDVHGVFGKDPASIHWNWVKNGNQEIIQNNSFCVAQSKETTCGWINDGRILGNSIAEFSGFFGWTIHPNSISGEPIQRNNRVFAVSHEHFWFELNYLVEFTRCFMLNSFTVWRFDETSKTALYGLLFHGLQAPLGALSCLQRTITAGLDRSRNRRDECESSTYILDVKSLR